MQIQHFPHLQTHKSQQLGFSYTAVWSPAQFKNLMPHNPLTLTQLWLGSLLWDSFTSTEVQRDSWHPSSHETQISFVITSQSGPWLVTRWLSWLDCGPNCADGITGPVLLWMLIQPTCTAQQTQHNTNTHYLQSWTHTHLQRCTYSAIITVWHSIKHIHS